MGHDVRMAYDWERLERAIRDARNAHGYSQEQLADAAGVGVTTIQNFEGRRRPVRWPRTLAHVEKALGWPAGRARAIATGAYDAEKTVLAPASASAPEGDFADVLRGMRLTEDLRQALLEDYERRRAREDAELREQILKIARSAEV